MRSGSLKATTAKPRSIDAYLARFPPEVRRSLATVRTSIAKALPGAEEAISYGIPAFKVDGRTVIYFAGWKEHYSLYPVTRRLTEKFKDALGPYEVSGKGTVRFPLSAPVPTKLIAAMAKFRAREAPGEARARSADRRR